MQVARLVSGGQSGVDRAALLVGQELGLPIGGWCPPGGWAEDVPDVRRLFPTLREAASVQERTRLNVVDSDATLVLVREGVASPGTEATVRLAVQEGRPHLVADVGDGRVVAEWLEEVAGEVLNVAGPRESQAPGICAEASALLRVLLGGR